MTLGKFCYNLRESFDNVFDSTLKDQSYFRPVRRVCVYFRLDDQLITVFADGGFHPCNSCDTFTLVRANIIQDFVSKEFLFDGSSFVTRSGMTVSEYLTFNEEKGGGIITKQDLISPSKED
ncbi:MAG: hypothetical protein GY865_07330 [candidate division Zixibacteria bacterium]|nr:hypothetical protein [candidate division Zixibacteria bacterium]